MIKGTKRKLFERIAWVFSIAWLLQWIIAAYTLEQRFAYGGAVTLLAVGVILIGIDVDN